jgi:type IV pilus assembly protein PilO
MLSKINLSGQNIALIVIAVSVLAAVAWYFTLYSNTLAESDTIRGEIETLNQQKQVGERARANVTQLCQTVADLERQKADFLRALPSNEQFSGLLETLRTQTGTNGGRINSLNRSAGSATGGAVPAGVKSIGINLSIEGSLDAIRGLLGAFEQQQRFLKVETLSLTQGGTLAGPNVAASNPTLSSTMAMTAYIYDNPNRNADAAPVNPVCQAVPGAEVPR